MALTPVVLYTGGQIATTATTLVTGPPNTTATIITAATFVNTDSAARTLTVYLVRSGGTPSAANALISGQQLAAGQSYIAPELQGQILATGDTLQAIADTSAKITCAAVSGYQVTA